MSIPQQSPARMVAGALAHLATHMETGCPRAAYLASMLLARIAAEQGIVVVALIGQHHVHDRQRRYCLFCHDNDSRKPASGVVAFRNCLAAATM
jgi:hypothetical protein